MDRQGAPRDAGRRTDLPAASPRHLLDRGSEAADQRCEDGQSQGTHPRQARLRIRRGHHRRGCGQVPCRRGTDLRLRRWHRRGSAQRHQACRHPVGDRPVRNPANAGSERPAFPHHRAVRRRAQDRSRRGDRRAAWRRGIRLRHRRADRRRLRHDARLPEEHLPAGHRHPGSGAPSTLQGQAGTCRQLLHVHRRGSPRTARSARLPHAGRGRRPCRMPRPGRSHQALEIRRHRPEQRAHAAGPGSGNHPAQDDRSEPRARQGARQQAHRACPARP